MNLNKKVERITEKEYRALKERASYSMLKTLDTDREKFFKEHVLGEKKIEKVSVAKTMGSLVHCILSGIEGDFDTKFHIPSAKTPSGQMGDLVQAMYTRSLQSTNEFGEQQDSFKIIFSDSVNKVKYDYEGNEVAFKKKDEDKILELFEGSDAEMYYREMLECVGKTLVSVSTVEQAERLSQKTKEHETTSVYFSPIEGNIERFHELPIQFEIDDVSYKCLPDYMEIDHDKQEVIPADWKSSFDNESPDESYVKYGYYIQAALYDKGIRFWMNEHGIGHYKLNLIRFIFIDTAGFNAPVDYRINQIDLERANRGFVIRGRRYKGLTQLHQDLQFHLESGVWSTTKELHDSKGIYNSRIAYGSR